MTSVRPNRNVPAVEGSAQRGTRPRILVVDDMQDNLDLVVELFEQERWNVKEANNSKDAWALIKRWQPDLVLLDIQMPDYNGHHLCAAIRMRSDMDSIRVIFLTAKRTSKAEIDRGMKMGAVDYICKPIDGAALRERVRAALLDCPVRAADVEG